MSELVLFFLCGLFALLFLFLLRRNRNLAVQLNQKYEQLNLLKSQRTELIASVSHDLKTPLTSIKGYAETLRDGALEDPQAAQKFLARILESSAQVIDLVENILDLSRLEGTNAQLRVVEVNIQELFLEIEEKFSFLINQSHQNLKFKVDTKTVRADRRLLMRAISNLIENAHRYCDEAVTISVSARPVENGSAWVEFVIQDDGPGIPKEDLERIFERFYRGEKSRHRSFGGSGLGLAIVKHTMISHGGQVHVDSRLNEGTIFHLLFPC